MVWEARLHPDGLGTSHGQSTWHSPQKFFNRANQFTVIVPSTFNPGALEVLFLLQPDIDIQGR